VGISSVEHGDRIQRIAYPLRPGDGRSEQHRKLIPHNHHCR
jgi:hypothetical protein